MSSRGLLISSPRCTCADASDCQIVVMCHIACWFRSGALSKFDQFYRSSHWCRRQRCRGCKCTPKSFDLVKIRAKSLKTFTNTIKIWAKMVINMLWFEQKWCPKWHEEVFAGHFFGVFSGKFGRIWEKILCAPKTLPALKPMCQASSKPGVPNLSLTMYPFSIPTDKYVPLQHFTR